ncbi:ABC transporter ATP-binding protein [Fundicoccus culcitae]|uniref:ATP-binding cassette domain-containing protein n=1 Tax=Fundicoccus culcitae TaxID=2969821 RepID=A0ABY5P4D8_9LACT|nr:ATP-binding cassette domain-containing protein [Fundicoccus culcitae]UUX33608.1 ATP-binding cassette domain-containing protein [Fundicoccus culcitae]
MVPAIEVINLSKSFGKTTILDDVSCHFNKGQIHGIIGRNGAGKTILMKSICGFIRPDKGEIKIDGELMTTRTDKKLEDIGIIIESPGFLPAFDGYSNLKYLASIRNVIGAEEINQVLETVGLTAAAKKKVGKYSMGMRQRLGIAQAIMENQSILILDEPMNGLDNRGVNEMRELFLKLKSEGKTIILASHSKEDIEILCDTVIEMDHGKIIASR